MDKIYEQIQGINYKKKVVKLFRFSCISFEIFSFVLNRNF